jgi:FAD/FMN-containing dehydrogenase
MANPAVAPETGQTPSGSPWRAARRFAAASDGRIASRATTVNDLHSKLNPTRVAGIVRPASIGELQRAVREARDQGLPISVCGGRHSMGGQQFCRRGLLVDSTALNRILDLDVERGLVTVEAGIQWPALVNHLAWAGAGQAAAWGIIQKQTGADRLTLGGALASNIHGRGLRLKPIVADVEQFEIVNPAGELVRCSRMVNPDLFALAIGGYGLFGAIATVTLRLATRHLVQRRVAIGCIDQLPELFDRRLREGFEYGDFQFATDPHSREFLQAGVFSCYRPTDVDGFIPEQQHRLTERDWRRLLLLAHTNKSRAFAEYARHYMSTDGQIYWSDTHQLAEYLDDYHSDLDRHLAASAKGSEMISELYVPRWRMPAFMEAVRADGIRFGYDIIYGTVRLIERDDESVLAWARQPWACVVFNLHVEHTPAGLAKVADHFRRLIDRAIEQDGSYYLTYHKWATAEQARRSHPRLEEFLASKRQYDPDGVFQSDWYRHHLDILEVAS